ncbi:hypothetical protein IWX49DRAFT_370396 [Phyllosticta citricarpa]
MSKVVGRMASSAPRRPQSPEGARWLTAGAGMASSAYGSRGSKPHPSTTRPRPGHFFWNAARPAVGHMATCIGSLRHCPLLLSCPVLSCPTLCSLSHHHSPHPVRPPNAAEPNGISMSPYFPFVIVSRPRAAQELPPPRTAPSKKKSAFAAQQLPTLLCSTYQLPPPALARNIHHGSKNSRLPSAHILFVYLLPQNKVDQFANQPTEVAH